jgi:hypothetical protein
MRDETCRRPLDDSRKAQDSFISQRHSKTLALPLAPYGLRRGGKCLRGVSPEIDIYLFAGKEGQECSLPQLIITYPTQFALHFMRHVFHGSPNPVGPPRGPSFLIDFKNSD